MDSQEAHSSWTTTAREKVESMQKIRDRESKWNHRKSLAWDTAFSTNAGVLDPEELFGSLELGGNEIEVGGNHKHSFKRLPSVPEMSARPSFAWDNAFFTDPGVLDAEELSLVNNGFNTRTPLKKSAVSTRMTTEGSRLSVSSIEVDLFHDVRASLRNSSSNVKQTVTREIKHKLPDGKKRTRGCSRQKDQPLSLIPQPKVSSSSPSISKPMMTPIQAKPAKKSVMSELGRNKVKHMSYGFEEQSGSKSMIRSSYSGYKVKDLTSSCSSGLRLPLPKMGFFDSENEEKENREPNTGEAAAISRRRRLKSKLDTTPLPQTRSILGQRKTWK